MSSHLRGIHIDYVPPEMRGFQRDPELDAIRKGKKKPIVFLPRRSSSGFFSQSSKKKQEMIDLLKKLDEHQLRLLADIAVDYKFGEDDLEKSLAVSLGGSAGKLETSTGKLNSSKPVLSLHHNSLGSPKGINSKASSLHDSLGSSFRKSYKVDFSATKNKVSRNSVECQLGITLSEIITLLAKKSILKDKKSQRLKEERSQRLKEEEKSDSLKLFSDHLSGMALLHDPLPGPDGERSLVEPTTSCPTTNVLQLARIQQKRLEQVLKEPYTNSYGNGKTTSTYTNATRDDSNHIPQREDNQENHYFAGKAILEKRIRDEKTNN